MGRLVINHSTYLEGLIEFLNEMAKENHIKTITPGRLYKVKGKADQFRVRVSCCTDNGFKLIARKGRTAQEIFVVTKEREDRLKLLIEEKIFKTNKKSKRVGLN